MYLSYNDFKKLNIRLLRCNCFSFNYDIFSIILVRYNYNDINFLLVFIFNCY